MIELKKHTWIFLLLLVVLLGVGSIATAVYPTAFWQIGSDETTGKMIYKYGDANSPTEHLTIFPDGAIGIGSPTLSDGSGNGGQVLKLDVEGDVGAAIYCDEQGLNCFDTQTVFDIQFIADNSAWPTGTGIPYAGQEVYNQECQCVQVYKIQTGTWEPTYSRYMQYANSDFPLSSAEPGDVVFNTDCDCLWCYDGSAWASCADINDVASGSFEFDCDTNPQVLVPFYSGKPGVSIVSIPIDIASPQPGPVTLTVNDNGFAAQRKVVLDGTETSIILNPIQYDGSGAPGTHSFEILSYEGIGSCTADAEVKSPGSFEWDCRPAPSGTGTFTTTSASSGTLTVPITNATAGDITVRVQQNGFTATEYITLTGSETEIVLDPLSYDGSLTKNGLTSFSVASEQATGHCFGKVVLTP